MRVAVVAVVFFVVAINSFDLDSPVVTPHLIQKINNHPDVKFVAGVNSRFVGASYADAIRLMGVKLSGRRPALKEDPVTLQDIPTSFDSRVQWGSICPSTSEIRDQANCGSCWAFGAVEAMTDRHCISSGGANQPHLSAEDLNSCCDSCGDGCDGGDPGAAWDYWLQTGLVTGGNYGGGGCAPYTLAPCDHHVNGSLPPCGPIGDTPTCPTSCGNGDTWSNDLYTGSNDYTISNNVTAIQVEIMTYGPVEAAFTVYADFLPYKSGVYHHVTGDELGGHAVKILGWGVLKNTPYWLVANSWNTDWGARGYFMIQRGNDECGIEDYIVAGTPSN
jgi:cathepsin B